MRKTKILLDALAESNKKVTYCAVDLAHDSLIQVFRLKQCGLNNGITNV